jgi:hypothetical protein
MFISCSKRALQKPGETEVKGDQILFAGCPTQRTDDVGLFCSCLANDDQVEAFAEPGGLLEVGLTHQELNAVY